ncbi:MAG: tryptophan 7-halogenase [Acidobacteria bacterium]|nr:tryptophan 7-halogenase [Acidobacteriota bacterium]
MHPEREARAAVDVAVIGGGPAGASAARLLAAWGHSVLLLTKSDSGHPSLAESLPPSCRKVFDAVGVREAVEAAGFLTTGGNTVCWEGARPRAAAFGGGCGLQVLRRDFDRVLLAEAERAGAAVRTGVTVRGVAVPDENTLGAAGSDLVRSRAGALRGAGADVVDRPAAPVALSGRDELGRAVTAHARFVLDCSGRAGVIARRHRTRVQAGETTLALVGVWRRPDRWPLPECAPGDGRGGDAPGVGSDAAPSGDTVPSDDAQTLVEAYADGWAWSVPVSPQRRYVTVMVDPRTTQADRTESLRARYLAEVGKTTHLARLTVGAALESPPWACDASQYGARRFGGPGFLLVGDAATFIDPLSSFGVKKAMASGWLAAVATNTCLRHPERATLARDFHAGRERQIWESYRRQTAAFFAQVSHRELHPFWSDRSDPLGSDPVGAGASAEAGEGDDVVATLRADPAVQAAFEALRRAPSIRLRPTPAARPTTAPAVEGREIVAATSLSLDAGRAGTIAVRYLRGIDLPALLAMAGEHTQVPDLYAAYRRSHAPVELPDFLGALSVLLGRGVLRNDA